MMIYGLAVLAIPALYVCAHVWMLYILYLYILLRLMHDFVCLGASPWLFGNTSWLYIYFFDLLCFHSTIMCTSVLRSDSWSWMCYVILFIAYFKARQEKSSAAWNWHSIVQIFCSIKLPWLESNGVRWNFHRHPLLRISFARTAFSFLICLTKSIVYFIFVLLFTSRLLVLSASWSVRY